MEKPALQKGEYLMKKLRHKIFISVLAAVTLLFFTTIISSRSCAEGMPKELVIGYQAIPNPETVVKDLRWHEKALGIPVKWVKYDSGRHVNAALSAGNVDVALAGSSPCAAGISQGIPMEVIWIHDVIGDGEALVVKKKSGVSRLKDLAGKQVAVPFGSTTHYHLMLALKLSNIKPKQLKIINLEPGEMPAAWKKGDIDAAFVWEPTQSKLVENGGEVLLSSRKLAERGFPTADLCVVRKDFAAKYPSVVIKYLKNLDKAVKLYRSEPDKAASAVARQFGISPNEASRQMKGLIFLTGEEQLLGKYMGDMQLHFGLYSTLKDTADFLEKAKEIESSPPLPVFMRAVVTSYIQEIIPKKKGLAGPRPKTE